MREKSSRRLLTGLSPGLDTPVFRKYLKLVYVTICACTYYVQLYAIILSGDISGLKPAQMLCRRAALPGQGRDKRSSPVLSSVRTKASTFRFLPTGKLSRAHTSLFTSPGVTDGEAGGDSRGREEKGY